MKPRSKLAVFHNPHKIWFRTPLDCFYNRVKPPNKYDWILNLLPDGYEPAFYVEPGQSQGPFRGVFQIFNWNRLELILWMYLNRISRKNFLIIDSIDDLRQGDILFSFCYGNYNYAAPYRKLITTASIDSLRLCSATKIVHLSHYAYDIARLSENLKRLAPDILVAEADLRGTSSYFNKYFSWYKGSIFVLPFKSDKRFSDSTPFSQRENRAVATGTLSYVNDVSYIEHYGNDLLQALRKTILDEAPNISQYIHSEISDIRTGQIVFETQEADVWSRAMQLFSKSWRDICFLAEIIVRKENSLQGDRSYYKKGMVELYNTHTMFICAEEAIGLPGIGFIEGMACGTAYIGLKSEMYEKIGMVSGVHYIGHDGTIQDILRLIKFYQDNFIELENIARNGRDFVASIDYRQLLDELFSLRRADAKISA